MKTLTAINKCYLMSAVLVYLLLHAAPGAALEKKITVSGAVKKSLDLTIKDLRAMPEFHINAVPVLKEKQNESDKEALIEVADYGGVLLRDILERAGMRYKRKWEPAVFIRVKGVDKKEVVFSFGEIFYSCIGRSTLIAYRKNGAVMDSSITGPELIVSNDTRNGRRISLVSEIVVERVDIDMKVYEERKKKIVQPPTSQLEIFDKKSGKTRIITLDDLARHPKIQVLNKVQVGDCEGFLGVFSYAGIPLRMLLEREGFVSLPYRYDGFVSITSRSGFCATYSMGELFNSRLENNIVLAFEKDGKILDEAEGFAMMVVAEDNTGGRSVKQISRILID